MKVTFRRLADEDLPLLHRWLNEPGVVRWWEGDDVSWEAVVRDYGSRSSQSCEYWIASVRDQDVGWIQCYATADYADEDEVSAWWRLGVARTAAGIDYLLGEPEARGRALRSLMIRAFVRDVLFARHPECTEVCASPVATNIASWRALEKAGFKLAGIFDDPRLGQCRLMVLNRADSP